MQLIMDFESSFSGAPVGRDHLMVEHYLVMLGFEG